jgi:hypothetical protein
MELKESFDFANKQLDRILSFFPRVDAKASVLLAINTTMLALLATNAPILTNWRWYMFVVGAVPVILIGFSLYHLYHNAFPQLSGGNESMIYFRRIASSSEHHYIETFKAKEQNEITDDLLGQVWRNSEILTQKYNHLRLSFIFLAWSLVPWAFALGLFVSKHTSSQSFLLK